MSVNGFVDNMAEWMSACDTIVTKAGPGTIAESLICGLPVLLNGFVPCQEAGNVPFVIDNQVDDGHIEALWQNAVPTWSSLWMVHTRYCSFFLALLLHVLMKGAPQSFHA